MKSHVACFVFFTCVFFSGTVAPSFVGASAVIESTFFKQRSPVRIHTSLRLYVVLKNTDGFDITPAVSVTYGPTKHPDTRYNFGNTQNIILLGDTMISDGIFIDGTIEYAGDHEVRVVVSQNSKIIHSKSFYVIADIDTDNDGILNQSDSDDDNDGLPDDWEELYGLNTLAPQKSDDADNDGLTDIQEFFYQTNPTNNDTDGDNMSDLWETNNSLNPTNPSDGTTDTDGDKLSNTDEFTANTNPFRADTDGDGLPDGWEATNDLNPNQPLDALDDNDNDKLTNAQEYIFGSDPNTIDTDGDTLSDSWEHAYQTNPNIDDSQNDPDGDGFTIFDEMQNNTSPFDADTDSDGILDGNDNEPLLFNEVDLEKKDKGPPVIALVKKPILSIFEDRDQDGVLDVVEKKIGLNTNIPDGLHDPDGDGLPTWQELEINTSAFNADSDGDGVLDGDEYRNNLDPLDKSDIHADPDGDGLTTAKEIAVGLDPFSKKTISPFSDKLVYGVKKHAIPVAKTTTGAAGIWYVARATTRRAW